MLKNTTNLPDRLVAIAAAFAMAELCGEGETLPVGLIKIRNKKRGHIAGQWGWYFPQDQEVHVIVPRRIGRQHTFRLRFTKKSKTFCTRHEFLVSVLAHELRHAWQQKHWNTPAMKWRLERTRVGKLAREVDAELYEMHVLRRWQHEVMPLLQEVA